MTYTQEQMAAIRDFREQGLSVRAAYALVHLDCLTIDDAAELTDLQLRRTANSGKKTISEIMGHRRYSSGRWSWQPIETAPKDESDLLGYCAFNDGSFAVYSMFWDSADKLWLASRPDVCEVAYPTHWMRLPEPPAQLVSSP